MEEQIVVKNKSRKDMAPDELKLVREADAARKRQDRADAKALTSEGRKMANSQIVVKANDADEILRERGLHNCHSKSEHIRDTVYWLATQTAEHLGLPGPNYHLLRYGFYATAAALADLDFVPPATPAEEMRLVSADDHDPDSDPPGELVTYFELHCMMEMQAWKAGDARGARPEQQLLEDLEAWKARKSMLTEKQAALQAGDAAVDALGVSPERAQRLKEAGRALQELAAEGVDAQQAFLMAAIRAEMDKVGPEEEARIAALPADDRAAVLAAMPTVARVMTQFGLSLED